MVLPGGGSLARARRTPSRAVLIRWCDRVFCLAFGLSLTRRSSTPVSAAVNARGGASGAERLSIVIQKTRQLRMEKSEIRLDKRWAVLSFESSAIQPDLRI